MTTAGHLLELKGQDIWSVSADATVYEALKVLADKNIGAVLVLDETRLVGMFSERDYARKVVLQGKSSLETRVGEIMTRKVLYVPPERRVEECLALMTEKRIRHLPVIADAQLRGVISIGDAVKWIISDQHFMIEQLEHYIQSG